VTRSAPCVSAIALAVLMVAPMPPVVLTTDVLRGSALLIACGVILIVRAFRRPHSSAGAVADGVSEAPATTAFVALVSAGIAAAALGADTGADPGAWLPWVLGSALVAAWSSVPAETARRTVVLALAGVAAVALAQHVGAPLFGAAHAPFDGRRAISTIGNPTIAGIAMAAGLAGARGRGADRYEQAAIALLAAGVVVSTSRVAWLAAFAGVLLAGRHGALGARRALAIGCGVGLAAVFAFGASVIDRVAEAPAAVAGRWDAVWASVQAMPARVALVGDGPGAFGRAWPNIAARDDTLDPMLQHLHFDALEIAWAIGGPVTALALGFVVLRVTRGLHTGDASRPGAAMLTTLAIAGLAQPVLFVHATLAVAAAAWRIARADASTSLIRRDNPPPEGSFESPPEGSSIRPPEGSDEAPDRPPEGSSDHPPEGSDEAPDRPPEGSSKPPTSAASVRDWRVIALVVAVAVSGTLAARRVLSDAALYPALTTAAQHPDDVDPRPADRAVRLDPSNPRARLVRGLDPNRSADLRCDDLARVVRVRPEPALVRLRTILRCE